MNQDPYWIASYSVLGILAEEVLVYFCIRELFIIGSFLNPKYLDMSQSNSLASIMGNMDG